MTEFTVLQKQGVWRCPRCGTNHLFMGNSSEQVCCGHTFKFA